MIRPTPAPVVRFLLLAAGFMLASLFLPPRAVHAQERVCPGSVVSRLHVGGVAQVTPGPHNAIWSNWTRIKHRIGIMEAGVTMDVLDGPECRVGITWWKVRSHKDGIIGWTGEGRGDSYWLMPVDQESCTPPADEVSAADLRAWMLSELGVNPADHTDFDIVAARIDASEPLWYVHSVGAIFDGPIPSHFLAVYTFNAGTCSWVEIARVVIQDENGVELPEVSGVQVQLADGAPYFLVSANYLPGSTYRLYRLQGSSLSLVDQGFGGRRGVFELHKWGIERLAVLNFDPGAGGPIPEGMVNGIHMTAQVDIGGPFEPLLNVELAGHLFAYKETLPEGLDLPLLVVGFVEEAHSPWKLRVTQVDKDGIELGVLVEFAYIPIDDGMYMAPVNNAVWRYDTMAGGGSLEQVMVPPQGLLFCADIQAVLADLIPADGPDIVLLLRDPDGSTMPVPDPENYWVWLDGSATLGSGWAIRVQEVLLSCPGLFDPHTGEPNLAPEGEPYVLMLLPVRVDGGATAPDLTVDMVVPRFELIPLPRGVDGFNTIINGFVTGEVTEIENALADWEPVEGLGSSLWASYEVVGISPRVISVLLQRNHYLSGAAHPAGGSHVSINYDLEADRQIGLSELFLPGVNYLPTLVTLAEEQLGYLGFETDPLTADEATFQHWNIGLDGLRISFDTYQIASYAAGPIQVTIPFAALADLLDPNGPAAEFYPPLSAPLGG